MKKMKKKGLKHKDCLRLQRLCSSVHDLHLSHYSLTDTLPLHLFNVLKQKKKGNA